MALRWRESKQGTNTRRGGKTDTVRSRYFYSKPNSWTDLILHHFFMNGCTWSNTFSIEKENKRCPGHLLASICLWMDGCWRWWCWRNPLPQGSCHAASDHWAGCRVPGNLAPNKHCHSGRQPGHNGWRCFHA